MPYGLVYHYTTGTFTYPYPYPYPNPYPNPLKLSNSLTNSVDRHIYHTAIPTYSQQIHNHDHLLSLLTYLLIISLNPQPQFIQPP